MPKSIYTKNMCKRINQKENVQSYPYPRPAGVMSDRNPEGATKQEGMYGTTSPNSKLSSPNLAGVMNERSIEGATKQGAMYGTSSPNSKLSSPNVKATGNKGKFGGFSHKAPSQPTDLHCYFQCPETFKKDYDLRLHLKLRHKHEDPDEISKAEEAAEEEIAFVSRSGSRFQCALCQKMFTNDNTMYSHVIKIHNLSWMDYKEKYGRSEVESSPFECKICGGVVKYTPNVVHSHLKGVHGIDWVKYLDRIRKLNAGEQPDELPQIETFECKICNSSVKFFREHLKTAHKISQAEYQELF